MNGHVSTPVYFRFRLGRSQSAQAPVRAARVARLDRNGHSGEMQKNQNKRDGQQAAALAAHAFSAPVKRHGLEQGTDPDYRL